MQKKKKLNVLSQKYGREQSDAFPERWRHKSAAEWPWPVCSRRKLLRAALTPAPATGCFLPLRDQLPLTAEGVTSNRARWLCSQRKAPQSSVKLKMENKTTGMFVIPPWLLFIMSVAALMTELSGETRPSFTGWGLRLLTVGVKHSGDKANCGRLVGVLLGELYQELKCPCRRERECVSEGGWHCVSPWKEYKCGGWMGREKADGETIGLLKIWPAGLEGETNPSVKEEALLRRLQGRPRRERFHTWKQWILSQHGPLPTTDNHKQDRVEGKKNKKKGRTCTCAHLERGRQFLHPLIHECETLTHKMANIIKKIKK